MGDWWYLGPAITWSLNWLPAASVTPYVKPRREFRAYSEAAMKFDRAFIPAGLCWSSPFARWQGPLAEISALDLAASVTRRALQQHGVAAESLTQVVLGWTVPQEGAFYGAPTLAGRIGAAGITGPMVS